MDNNNAAQAGETLGGKEDAGRATGSLASGTRKAKLSRRRAVEREQAVSEAAAGPKEQSQADDIYFDVLLRFGIQI
jgi:hypothetical protein